MKIIKNSGHDFDVSDFRSVTDVVNETDELMLMKKMKISLETENLSPFKNYFVNQIEYKLNFSYFLCDFSIFSIIHINFIVDRYFLVQRVHNFREKNEGKNRITATKKHVKCENNKSWDIRRIPYEQ